jgi:uncharacterized repeat protein (TIGR01451 family)
MQHSSRVITALALMASALVVVLPATPAGAAIPVPVLPSGSEVHAVIQVETSAAYAGDTVNIDSSQLEEACGGLIEFETLQHGSTVAPHIGVDSIQVVLDDDGNVTVVVDGGNCAPGTDVVEADLTVAPFLTATTILNVQPPGVTPEGLFASPASEVETGDTADSGDSDIYTVFTVETNPVYAEQTVELSSPQLEDRCITGWRLEPGSGLAPIDQDSGTTTATGILDDDGNATFVFKGSSCATGPSAVIADVLAGSHPTYVTTFTVEPPAGTVATVRLSAAEARTGKAAHKHHRRHRGQGGGAGSGPGSGAPADPPPMTVTVNPSSLVLTGVPGQGTKPPAEGTLNVVKSDDDGGSSDGGYGNAYAGDPIEYTITITNSGPTTITDVEVEDNLSNSFDGGSYTSVENDGATGASSGNSGGIDNNVTLPPGSSVVYTLDTTIDCQAGSPISNEVDLTPEPGTELTSGSNTTAVDYDYITGLDPICSSQ